MDHTLYPFSALPLRQTGALSGRSVLSAYVVLFLEHWDFESPAGSLRDPRFVGEYGSFHPDFRSWSQREYGLRIGIFRVIDALQQAGICPVIAANSMAAERLPQLVQRLNDWGCEWLGHGIAATRMMHSEQSLEVQTEHIQSSSCQFRSLRIGQSSNLRSSKAHHIGRGQCAQIGTRNCLYLVNA